MKVKDEALELADKKGIELEEDMKGVYKKKQIWYKRAESANWLWFAESWTKAHKRLKDLGRKKI
jgi:hypothetical protein